MRARSQKSPLLRLLLVASLLATGLMPSISPLAAASYAQGERVQFTGVVTDREGQPLANVRVALEASRTYFSLRHLRREQAEMRRVSTTTNGQGEYSLDWPWDSYFNHFELVVGVPVRKAQDERLEELERTDVTRRALAGSPVVSAIVVQNSQFVRALREFMASVKSADEQRVYGEMGRPDKVERVQYPGWMEVSWWYFDAGRVYRFRDGRLEQVVPFEPVKDP